MNRITTAAGATALALLSLLLSAAAAEAVPPPNNAFGSAAAVTTVPANGTVSEATAEANEPAHAGQPASRSVWYSWTAPEDQLVQVDTCFQELSFQSRLATYRDGPGTGTSVGDLISVADSSALPGYCGNNFGSGGAIEQFRADQGTTYSTAVDTANGFAGAFELYLIENVPSPAITSGPTGETTDPTPTFTFSSTEPGAVFWCGVVTQETAEAEGISLEECGSSGSFTSPALADGSYVFGVVAVDPNTGAYDFAGAVRQFSVKQAAPPDDPPPAGDEVAPETTIDAHPKSKTRKRKARFEFSSNEPGSTFECALNDASFAPCSSPHEVRAKKGRNTFRVRATDAAGNTDATPATYRWKYKKRRRSRALRGDGTAGRAIAPPAVLPAG